MKTMPSIEDYLNESIVDKLIISEAIELFPVGSWVKKTVKKSGGVTSGTEGFVVDIKHGEYVIADEWGGMNKNKTYEPKGFKLGKKKSKTVTNYKPVLDLIQQFGHTL